MVVGVPAVICLFNLIAVATANLNYSNLVSLLIRSPQQHYLNRCIVGDLSKKIYWVGCSNRYLNFFILLWNYVLIGSKKKTLNQVYCIKIFIKFPSPTFLGGKLSSQTLVHSDCVWFSWKSKSTFEVLLTYTPKCNVIISQKYLTPFYKTQKY